MNICENHSKMIILHEAYSCPVCEMEEALDQAKDEARQAEKDADRIGKDNNDLCDKISDLEGEIKTLKEGM